MFYYHRKMPPQASSSKPQAAGPGLRSPGLRLGVGGLWRDHRGVASIEGIVVLSLLGAVFLCCLLLAQWGVHVQSAQMGARLLAFNSGDANLARFGRSADTATQTFSTGRWDTLASSLPTNWLNTMFTTLTDDYYSGYVKGQQRGRLTNTGRSLFSFSSRSVGYFSSSAAALNPWSGTAASARSTFMGIAYYVGRYRVSAQSISSIPTIPATIPLLETIYSRVGGR